MNDHPSTDFEDAYRGQPTAELLEIMQRSAEPPESRFAAYCAVIQNDRPPREKYQCFEIALADREKLFSKQVVTDLCLWWHSEIPADAAKRISRLIQEQQWTGEYWRRAIRSRAGLGDASVAADCRRLFDEGDPPARADALHALGTLRTAEAIAELETIWNSPVEQRWRLWAGIVLATLGYHRDPELEAFLEQELRTHTEPAPIGLAFGLAGLGNRLGINKLREYALEEPLRAGFANAAVFFFGKRFKSADEAGPTVLKWLEEIEYGPA